MIRISREGRSLWGTAFLLAAIASLLVAPQAFADSPFSQKKPTDDQYDCPPASNNGQGGLLGMGDDRGKGRKCGHQDDGVAPSSTGKGGQVAVPVSKGKKASAVSAGAPGADGGGLSLAAFIALGLVAGATLLTGVMRTWRRARPGRPSA